MWGLQWAAVSAQHLWESWKVVQRAALMDEWRAARKDDSWVELRAVRWAPQTAVYWVDGMVALMVAMTEKQWAARKAVCWGVERVESMDACWADSKGTARAAQMADWTAVLLVVRWAVQTEQRKVVLKAGCWAPSKAE
jgi:hypothetical protein